MTRRGQKLAALTMLLQSVRKGATDPKTGERLAECLEVTREAAQEIRTVAQLLHPPLLDETGLVSTLRSLLSGLPRKWN
ncbi:MAG TPA: histidine kinase [Candidatus Acidoferrales bacterium]|nr:histidine kinase [Candidatus Acidoferrales bacterium]